MQHPCKILCFVYHVSLRVRHPPMYLTWPKLQRQTTWHPCWNSICNNTNTPKTLYQFQRQVERGILHLLDFDMTWIYISIPGHSPTNYKETPYQKQKKIKRKQKQKHRKQTNNKKDIYWKPFDKGIVRPWISILLRLRRIGMCMLNRGPLCRLRIWALMGESTQGQGGPRLGREFFLARFKLLPGIHGGWAGMPRVACRIGAFANTYVAPTTTTNSKNGMVIIVKQ